MAQIIIAAVLFAGLAMDASAQQLMTNYFECACPGSSVLQKFNDSDYASCEEACGGSRGRAPAGPDWNAIRLQEEAENQARRDEADRKALAERREREAREQREFNDAKGKAMGSLKGVSKGDAQLKGVSGTDMFGLKGVDPNKTQLKGVGPTVSSRGGRETPWKQLVCAAVIGGAVTDAAKVASTREEIIELDFLRGQSASAMNGGELEVACDPAGALPSSFEPWKDNAKKKYDEFLKTVADWARTRVEVRAKIPVYRTRVKEAEKKLEAIRIAQAAKPAAPAQTTAPAAPADDDLLKRAEKLLAESKSVLASAERIEKEDTAKLEKADKVHDKFLKAPEAGSPDDLLNSILGGDSK